MVGEEWGDMGEIEKSIGRNQVRKLGEMKLNEKKGKFITCPK